MARIKYYYDTETCNYERIKTSRWNTFFDLVGFLSSSFLIAVCIFWSYTAYFDSPRETRLKQENDLLRTHYAQIQKEIENSNQVLAYLRHQDDHLYRVILEMEPASHTAKKVVISAPDRYRDLRDKNKLIATTFQKVDQLKKQLYSQSKSYDALYKLAQEKRNYAGFSTRYSSSFQQRLKAPIVPVWYAYPPDLQNSGHAHRCGSRCT